MYQEIAEHRLGRGLIPFLTLERRVFGGGGRKIGTDQRGPNLFNKISD